MGQVVLGNGIELYVNATGKGEALILAPGWAYSNQVFMHNQPRFAKYYHTISYDPRSHGLSPTYTDGHHYLQHGHDLHEIIEYWGFNKVHLLGWSLGVYDCLAYIEQHGLNRVASLIMVDESCKIIADEGNSWGEGSADEIEGLLVVVDSDRYLDFFRDYMQAGFVGEAPQEWLNHFTQYASKLTPSQAAGLLRDASQLDFRKTAQQAAKQVPTLAIVREDWSEAACQWLNQYCPETQMHILGGHLMLMEYPDDFNRLVLNFLQQSSTHNSACVGEEVI